MYWLFFFFFSLAPQISSVVEKKKGVPIGEESKKAHKRRLMAHDNNENLRL